MYKYETVETRSLFSPYHSYGILVKEELNGNWVAVAVAAPFSHDREAVAKLAETCSSLQLSPIHLIDVVSDFISQNATSS